MGDLLRRRMMILPGDGLPEWDYEWDYTMGLLSNNGWEKKVSGTASETLTSTGDSLKSSGNGYVYVHKEDFDVPIGVIEVTFYVTGFAGLAPTNTRICFSNGAKGIQICSPGGQLRLFDSNIPNKGTILGAKLAGNIDYTLRLVLNGQVGEVWLDGVRLISDVDISTIYYSAKTAIWSQEQNNYETVVKSVKLRKNRI